MRLVTLIFFILSCSIKQENKFPKDIDWIEFFDKYPNYKAQEFIYPVGKNGSAQGYYVAQGFGEKNKRFGGNKHLGEDWNGIGGGDSDYGDPILAISNGYVVYVGFAGIGWGDVIRIVHYFKQDEKIFILESIYAHISKSYVQENQFVTKGQKIAEIGNAGGLYPAHLHFELRDNPKMDLGGGYASDTEGFLNPRKFIQKQKRLYK